MNTPVQEFIFRTVKPNRTSNFINRVWFNGETAQLAQIVMHLKKTNNIHYASLLDKLREVDEFIYEYCCVRKNNQNEVGYFNTLVIPFFITDLASIQQLCPKVQNILLRTCAIESGATYKYTHVNPSVYTRGCLSIDSNLGTLSGTKNTLIFASVAMNFNVLGKGSMNDFYWKSNSLNPDAMSIAEFFNKQRMIKRRVMVIYQSLQKQLPIEIICLIIEHYLDDGQQKIYPHQLRYLMDAEYKEELEMNTRKRKRDKYLAFTLRTNHPKRVLKDDEYYSRQPSFTQNVEEYDNGKSYIFSEGIY